MKVGRTLAQVHVNYFVGEYKMKLNFGNEIKYNF